MTDCNIENRRFMNTEVQEVPVQITIAKFDFAKLLSLQKSKILLFSKSR